MVMSVVSLKVKLVMMATLEKIVHRLVTSGTGDRGGDKNKWTVWWQQTAVNILSP